MQLFRVQTNFTQRPTRQCFLEGDFQSIRWRLRPYSSNKKRVYIDLQEYMYLSSQPQSSKSKYVYASSINPDQTRLREHILEFSHPS